jgi:hypothetical protein
MQDDSLLSFGEAMKKGKCRLVYLDLGNSSMITDEAVIKFCEDLNRSSQSPIPLETLILRGNSSLKLEAG